MGRATALRHARAFALLSAVGCVPDPTPTTPTAAPPILVDPCVAARAQRARVGALLAEGRLDRARRVARRAAELCPAEEPAGWAAELAILVELGDVEAAVALARRVDASPAADDAARDAARAARGAAEANGTFADTDEAKGPMRDAYKRAAEAADRGELEAARAGFVRAWELWRPNGQALIQAGLVAERMGDGPGAQRLFDRGVAELERSTKKPLTLDTPNGFGAISAVAWSSRGRIAVAHGRVVSILAQGDQTETARIVGHTGRVLSVAFSSDGKLLATAGADRTVRLWEVATGVAVGALGEHTDEVTAVAFSGDGATLASASRDGSVHLSDPAAGASRVLALGGEVEALAIHGGLVAAAVHVKGGRAFGQDRVAVVDAASGRSELSIPFRAASLAISRDGGRLLASGRDGSTVFDAKTGDALATFSERWALLTPDGARVAVVGERGVRVVAIAAASASAKPSGARNAADLTPSSIAPTSMAFSPSGDAIVVGSEEGTLGLLKLSDHFVRRIGTHSLPVREAATSPSEQRLAIASGERRVRVWDLASGAMRSLDAPDRRETVAFSARGDALVAGGEGGVEVWDLASGARRPLDGETGFVGVARFSADGRVAAGSVEAAAHVWSDGRGTPASLPTTGDVGAVAFSADGHTLATGARNGGLWLWDPNEATRVRVLGSGQESVWSLAFSPDGGALASALVGGVQLWDLRAAHEQASATNLEGCQVVAFSADGRWLATGARSALGDCSDVRVSSVSMGQPPRSSYSLVGHDADVSSVAFTASGRIVTASVDGSVIVWSGADRRRIATLRALADADAGYVFSPDGFIEFVGAERDKAKAFPRCRVDRAAFPFEVCRERFEVAHLLPKLLAGDASYRDP